jgi:hypothetical protein
MYHHASATSIPQPYAEAVHVQGVVRMQSVVHAALLAAQVLMDAQVGAWKEQIQQISTEATQVRVGHRLVKN